MRFLPIMEAKRVIVVEDDREICELLAIHLRDLSCEVTAYHDGRAGLAAVVAQPPDLVILDVMLPSLDGLEVCRQVRAQNVFTPILMLTARSEEIDRVLGLEIGADDYLTKPFSVREFLARVKAIFRRARLIEEQVQTDQRAGALRYGPLEVNVEMRRVMLDGRPVSLSPKEFELLALMAANPGKSYKRTRLLNLIWGYDFEGYEHTVNSHINRLRSKIEADTEQPRYILTVWGVGYKFNEELVGS